MTFEAAKVAAEAAYRARETNRMDTENETIEGSPAASGSKGKFFAVDWRCVEDATRYGDGVNTAIAYLALAHFTDRTQTIHPCGYDGHPHENRAYPWPC